MPRPLSVLLWLLLPASALGQSWPDTARLMPQLDVVAARGSDRRQAGKTERRVDTLELAERVHLSLSEVLGQATVVHIKDHGRGALATASFRGTSPTHTRVSWNGISINSPMLGMVDFALVPAFIVDDLTLRHGGASVADGSGGLGGHIAMGNAADWRPGLRGRYVQGAGSYGTWDEYAQVDVGGERFQSRTRVYHNRSRNDYPFVNKHIADIDPATGLLTHPVERNRGAAYRKVGAQQELYGRLRGGTAVSAKIWAQDARRGVPMAMSYEGGDSARRENLQSDRTLRAVVDASRSGGRWKAAASSGADLQRLDYVLRVRPGGADTVLLPVNSGSRMAAWHNRGRLDLFPAEWLTVALRADAARYDIGTRDTATQAGYATRRWETSLLAAAYAQALPGLDVALEARQELLAGRRSPLVANCGVSWRPRPGGGLSLGAGVSRNHRAPSLNDLYWQPGGNPDLLPEQGYTAEASLRWEARPGAARVDAQLSAYWSDIDNWILWLPSVKGFWEAQNVRRVMARGAECSASASLRAGAWRLSARVAYAFTRSTNESPDAESLAGLQLPFVPVHSGNATLAAEWRRWYARYLFSYNGERNLLNSNYESPDDNFPYYRLYAQPISNLSLGRMVRLGGRFGVDIELKINNLFNETYRSVLNRFMPGRNFTLLAKVSF